MPDPTRAMASMAAVQSAARRAGWTDRRSHGVRYLIAPRVPHGAGSAVNLYNVRAHTHKVQQEKRHHPAPDPDFPINIGAADPPPPSGGTASGDTQPAGDGGDPPPAGPPAAPDGDTSGDTDPDDPLAALADATQRIAANPDMHAADRMNELRGAVGLPLLPWTVRHGDRAGMRVGELLDTVIRKAGNNG